MAGEAICFSLTWWKEVSEVVKNLATLAAVGAAGWALYKWRTERFDRATEVLFKLQERFDSKELRHARQQIEDDTEYDSIRKTLESETTDRTPPPVTDEVGESRSQLDDLDELLRFYVFVYAVRLAGQVPDKSLSTCFRFWLAHYHHPQRKEFRSYVSEYFPTLRGWLEADRELRRCGKRGFFTPGDFGWKDEA